MVLPCPGEQAFTTDRSILHHGAGCAFSGSCDAFGNKKVREACRSLMGQLYYKDGLLLKKEFRELLYEALVTVPKVRTLSGIGLNWRRGVLWLWLWL